ncbi:16S rRNA (guanine(966)-N(2))-methyltransferase RsmD [Yoonia sp. MH D7]
MRIIGGTHRGTTLTDVGTGDTAAHLRPTGDRVRESLFNVLQGGRFGERVRGTRVLDLFAGTGALGLEALSRGAVHATFVDDGKVAARLLAANITKLRREADCKLIKADALKLPPVTTPCSLIFVDPPYGMGLGIKAMTAALKAGWVAKDALIVLEENSAQPAPRGFTSRDSRRYGDTWITLFEVSA